MDVYEPGNDVTVRIELVDTRRGPLDATSVEYSVTDATGAELVSRQTVSSFTSGTYEVSVTVPASANTLSDAQQGLRTVWFYITTSAGEVTLKQRYALQAHRALSLLVNSFQTLDEAELAALSLPQLQTWSSQDDGAKRQALTEAYRRLTRLKYHVDAEDNMQKLSGWYWVLAPGTWDDVTVYDWTDRLPEHFKNAIKRAQVIEADSILAGDESPAAKRAAGIEEEEVGQSVTSFRQSRPLRLPISRAALEHVSRYIKWTMTMGRA